MFEPWCHNHFRFPLSDKIFSKKLIFKPPVASQVGMRPCSAALASGTLVPVHDSNTWANIKWKHRPDRRLCRLRRTGFESGCRGVSCFLRAIFFNRVSKVNIPTNLQPSQFRSRRGRENVRVEKVDYFFSLLLNGRGFAGLALSAERPHAYIYSSGQTSSITAN